MVYALISAIPFAERLIKKSGVLAIKWLTPNGRDTFFDPENFPWTAELEAGWTKIRDELDRVLEKRDAIPAFQDVSPDQQVLTQDDNWKTYFLYSYGYIAAENCRRCPETTRLIESVPGMKTAFFSILAARKEIPSHTGPYKGVLRYHLGLTIPEPADQCGIRVKNDVRHWAEGKSLIFDDSHVHEAWNRTDGERVVLFLDFERPLPFLLSLWNRFVIYVISRSPFVQEMRNNQAKYGKLYDDRVGELKSTDR